jgi:hypothetical protein
MGKVSPYHTIEPELPPKRNVYHDHDDFRYGQQIGPRHLARGPAGRPRCLECQRLG